MKQSNLFTKTTKQTPSDEVSKNAQLLIKAGYVQKVTAGVYTMLPLGLQVIENIETIIREEMDAIGGQEVLMPALHPKTLWEKTGRWDKMDVMFKTKSSFGSAEYGLGPTHEEIVVPLVKQFVSSYKDLPVGVYQIQTKFRDEPRAKSGLLRGREFLMKDLYSFHTTEDDRADYYTKAIAAYHKIFDRCGFSEVIFNEASGGSFTKKFSHEFQVPTAAGEDTIVICRSCDWAQNDEIAEVKAGDDCPNCGKKLKEEKTIEVGNIFDLGQKFSDDFDLYYLDEKGNRNPVIIGCYGIGVSRIMGALVENLADDKGLVWPASVAPYQVHLLRLGKAVKQADKVYAKLEKTGISVLYDDRDTSNGEKLGDADLLGIPVRLVVSEKTTDKIEWKERVSEEVELIGVEEVIKRVK